MLPAIHPSLRRSLVVVGVATAVVMTAAQAAGVYKWTDGQGRTHYDDNNLLEQRLTIDYLNARGIPAKAESTTPREFVDVIHHQCQTLRERLQGYRSATSLESQDPAGNTYVLSPRQVQIEIATADRDQARYCAPGAAERMYRAQLAAPAASKITPVEQR